MQPIPRTLLRVALPIAAVLFSTVSSSAQVHHFPDGGPWNQRAGSGPDAEVPGWYYNLGPTGLRVELVDAAPKELLVRYVFAGTPAAGKLQVGDRITGVAGEPFREAHQNGYGMDVFGARGPIPEFARALEVGQGDETQPSLCISILRADEPLEVELQLTAGQGAYSKSFPSDCAKTERQLAFLLDYLVAAQRADGSWGSPPEDTFAPLALLASGKPGHLAAVEKNVRFHARTTQAKDKSSLINWRYMTAAIVMSEYFLATGAEWVVPELQEVYDFLISSQYMDLSQVSERVQVTHPDAVPKDALDSHGGWGHNPGYEGYGPIAMLTGQGALAFDLMARCGIAIDRTRHDAAFAFLERASGANGYVWYEDQAAGDTSWADMGRTGAAGIANWLSPYDVPVYQERALAHARVIGRHPESFPDTHGSPILGMGYAGLAAHTHPGSFRSLMESNRFWFLLSECADGSFYYQPNRDNAGYGADSRLSASAVVAFLFSIPKASLHVFGKPFAEAD